MEKIKKVWHITIWAYDPGNKLPDMYVQTTDNWGGDFINYDDVEEYLDTSVKKGYYVCGADDTVFIPCHSVYRVVAVRVNAEG